jgi:hypothetical protein
MTMLANTAIAVEHRHRRSPDVDAPAILHDEEADLLVSRERAAPHVKCVTKCLCECHKPRKYGAVLGVTLPQSDEICTKFTR